MRRFALVCLFTAGCMAGVPGDPAGGDDDEMGSGSGSGSGTGSGSGSGSQLEAGSLNVAWMHGSANCGTNTDPEVQVHAYNATVHIIRQNKCRTFEAPFVYVIEGATSALAIDTGATTTTTMRDTVRGLVGTKQLIVAHSHAHGDHTAGDSRFSGQPNTTVVATNIAAIQQRFGIATWPTSPGSLDLGGRVIDVIAIPGHEQTHVAYYDRKTGLLFTGDSFYPGLLFINDWATYRTSMHRLAEFASSHEIAHVLGAHIEMSSTPKQVYPYGTTYQPAEHVLELTAAHVAELDTALTQLGATPPAQSVAHDDFVLDPQ